MNRFPSLRNIELEIEKTNLKIVISGSEKLRLPKPKADSKNLGNRPIMKLSGIGNIQNE